jgi:hypothetical protein
MVGRLVRRAAGLLVLPTQVLALGPSPTPCSAFWNASAVFSGRVESIERAGQHRRVTFTVLDAYRGADVLAHRSAQREGGRGTIVEVASVAPCAARFRQGREFIVYAGRATDRMGSLFVDCSRTRELDDAAADLSYARSVVDGSAPVGSISGQVLIIPHDLARRGVGPAVPAAEIAVRVATSGADDRTVTNVAGDFSATARGAGAYHVSLELPPHLSAETAHAKIDLPDPRACGAVEFRLAYDGRLSGRVLDAAGRPSTGLTVEVSTTNLAQRRLAVTDRGGRYEFTGMPAGRFVIGVTSGPARDGKAPRTFLPGVSQVSAASRVILGAGERATAPDFRLPAAVRYVAISGLVLDADALPAGGAQVYVKGPAEGDRIVGEPVAVDFMGRFVVAILAGSEHAIFAERRRGTRVDSSEQVRIASGEAQKPIRLVLQRRY